MPSTPPPAAEPEPIKRVMVQLPDSLHHRLKVLAAERRQTMAEVIRDAVAHEVGRPA